VLTGVKIELGRRYRFAASHRLHTEKLSEEENARVFGKCANPYGHGHNYVLEVSVVEREVIEEFDHHSLNEDVAAFRDIVPTTENLCIEIYKRLKSFPKAKLERVRVQETTNNSFEYAGENGRENL
jgi:6-pyruvoyltetrahydropterin/6-carboxytetrahydropterin synthase